MLYLVQDSGPAEALGQSFQSDQSRSIHSSIGSLLQPAEQDGQGNSANVLILSDCSFVSGSCGHVDLSQNDSANSLSSFPALASELGPYVAGNTAALSVNGTGNATLFQQGVGNTAYLSATDAKVSIQQIGLDNAASMNLTTTGETGSLAQGEINQVGAANKAYVLVSAAPGNTVSYTQFGTGLTYGTTSSPVVVSTTQSINMVQTSF